jgi:hypothetical protein
MQNPQPDHMATWAVSFAAASFGVWSSWLTYLALGLRYHLPDWVLLYERPFFGVLLAVLMFGMVFTGYQARLFVRPGRGEGLA